MDVLILALCGTAVFATVGVSGALILAWMLGRLDDPAHEAEADAAGLDLAGKEIAP